MSDRREAVARAIQEAASTRTPYNNWLNMADAAIAAMQAEPTEAEIDAAIDAWFDSEPGDINHKRRMRAALLAARKARKEAGK